jgi:catechol 2,3-dioxygenase-like lactoylglutathione lyase family enzyme
MAVAIAGVHYHVGIVTRDLDEAMTSVGALFGLTWAKEEPILVQPALRDRGGPVSWQSERVVHSMGGPMRVELLQGGPGSVWHTDQPSVLHHVAYWVDDIAATAARLEADGWTLEVTTAGADDRPSMFAYLTKPGNARVEITDASRRDETLERLGWSQWSDYMR